MGLKPEPSKIFRPTGKFQQMAEKGKRSDGVKIGAWIRASQERSRQLALKGRYPPISMVPIQGMRFPKKTGPTKWGTIGPITKPPIKKVPEPAVPVEKPLQPRIGQPGWFAERERHAEARRKGWLHQKVSKFFGRKGITIQEYKEKQIEKKVAEHKLIPVPGQEKTLFRNTETDQRQTVEEVYHEIEEYEIPEYVTFYNAGKIDYLADSGRWVMEETRKEPTPSELRALGDFFRAKIRTNLPPKKIKTEKAHMKWFEEEVRKRENQMDKILPNDGAPISFEGTVIQANPQQKLFSDLRLNKTFNIAVNIRITDKNYDDIMGDIDSLYKQIIGRRLNIILHSLRSMYEGRGYMMGAKLNFTQHLSSGGEVGWYPTVRYISLSHRQQFETEIKDAMYDGLNTIKKSNYSFDMVEFVYIQIHFTTEHSVR
jgi:hypothetical protein